MTLPPWGSLHPHKKPPPPQALSHVPRAGCALTARLQIWMVRRAWLRLECLLRACAEVRLLWDPASGGENESYRGGMMPHAPAQHPLPTPLPDTSRTGSCPSYLPSEPHQSWGQLCGGAENTQHPPNMPMHGPNPVTAAQHLAGAGQR